MTKRRLLQRLLLQVTLEVQPPQERERRRGEGAGHRVPRLRHLPGVRALALPLRVLPLVPGLAPFLLVDGGHVEAALLCCWGRGVRGRARGWSAAVSGSGQQHRPAAAARHSPLQH